MNVDKLEGKTIRKVVGSEGSRTLEIIADDGSVFEMYHAQQCCENVRLEEVIGDLDDLIGEEIVEARESTDQEWAGKKWTFYHIRTYHSDVTLRWLGESNGYYSVSVDLKVVTPD